MASVAASVASNGKWVFNFSSSLRQDAVFYIAISTYISAAAILSAVFNCEYLWAIIARYVAYWGAGASVVVLCAAAARAAAGPPAPGGTVDKSWLGWVSAELTARSLLFIGLASFMGAFTTIKTLLPQLNPFWADGLLAEVDRALHFGVDPWRLFQPLLGSPGATRAVEVVYRPVWLAVTAVMPAWMALTCPDEKLRARFLFSFLILWIVNGTLLAAGFASGGPAFYGQITGDEARFAPLIAQVGAAGHGPFSALAQQQELWAVHRASGPGVGAGISAFPSMHVTMAVLCALAGAQISRRLGVLLWGCAGLILIGSVHLGWHYAVDGYVAIAMTLAVWRVAGRLGDRVPGRFSPWVRRPSFG